MRRVKLVFALALCALLVPVALAAGGDRHDARGGVAFVDLAQEFPLDPAVDFLSVGWQVEYATCAQLVNYPDANAPTGAQLQPEVAKSIDISSDGLTYTFRLRDDFRFSPPSNERVTADAFKRALERVRDPALASPGAAFFRDVASVTSDGDRRLTIRLARPDGDFLARLAMPFMCAVPPSTPAVEQRTPLPSAGPYYISNYTPGSRLILSRNPNYGGQRPSNLDQILYQFNVDLTTTLAQIESGTADYAASGIPPDSYAQFAHDFPSQFFVNALASLRHITLNTSRSLFSGVAARQAVNLVVDRPAILATGGAFAGTPTDQYIPPTVPGFRDESIYPLDGPSAPDIARANALVDQAGVRGRTAVLYTSDRGPSLAAADIIRADLAKIGLGVDIRAFPRQEQIAREGTRGEPFDMTIEGWIDDYLDPFDTLNNFFDGTTIGPVNNLDISYFDDPTVNAQLQAAEQLTGPARFSTYGDLDATLARDYAPIIAVGAFNGRDAFSSRIGCQTFVPPYGMDLAALCIKDAP